MKATTTTAQLLSEYPIISDQISKSALHTVLTQLELIIQKRIPGDIVEFGCYIGTTTVFLRRLLDEANESSKRLLYAYDSFNGLPDKTRPDMSGAGEQFQAGELCVTKRQFLHSFHKANLKPPITVKGWFATIRPDQLPTRVAYAFLDGDFYESIIESLRLVWPRLADGGVIAIDDYKRQALPGVDRAVRDFFQNKAVIIQQENNIGIIKPVH